MRREPVGLVLHTPAFDAVIQCRGHSANEVGRLAGVSPATLSRLRTSRRAASEATAEALATALEVHPAALFPQLAGWTPPEVTL